LQYDSIPKSFNNDTHKLSVKMSHESTRFSVYCSPFTAHSLSNANGFWALLLVLFLCLGATVEGASAMTVDGKYPGLASGMLKSAQLAPMDEDTLLVADGLSISRLEIMDAIKNEDAQLRKQFENDLFFILEQEATRRILLNEAKKSFSASGGDDNRAIQALIENKAGEVSVSDEEAESFYREIRKWWAGRPSSK
jgi:predicted DNA-binding protein YlxM (UPF0122 family)